MDPNPLPPENTSLPERNNFSKKNKLWIYIGIAVVLLTVLIGAFLTTRKSVSNKSGVLPFINNPFAKPTPSTAPQFNFVFPELTIPYLRNKKYESKLGELELYANNGNYTSYLTSYSSDGFKINGLLTVPNGEKPAGAFPAIIFIHGYIPPRQYQTTQNYADYVDTLSRNGFVVFKIDLRGHGDSEGEPGGGYFGSDYVVDVLNARAALQSSDLVNKDKIGLWGHSMAGNIVMRSMAVRPEIPAGVIWAGAVYSYTDLLKYQIKDISYDPTQSSTRGMSRRRLIFEKEGSPSATSSFWQQVAPTNFLNDLKGAVQLNHAVDDNVVNIGYSRDLNDLLDKTSVPHEFHIYDSGGHNISGASFTEAMQNTIDFFKKYL